MLNLEYPDFEKISLDELELKLSEPIKKINIRGKKKEFFTKAGKVLSIILPIEPNTGSSNQQFNALWLSPDEWLVYFNENNNTHTGSAINKSDLIINIGVDQMMSHSPWPKNKKKIIEIISSNQNKTISNDPLITYSGNIKEILKNLVNNITSEGWNVDEFKNINKKLDNRSICN